MLSSSFVTYFLVAFVIGLAISNMTKIYFAIRNRKQEQAFLKVVQEKMTDLSTQIERRSQDMQETVEAVNSEYNYMLTDMANKMRTDYSGSLKDKQDALKQMADDMTNPKVVQKPDSE